LPPEDIVDRKFVGLYSMLGKSILEFGHKAHLNSNVRIFSLIRNCIINSAKSSPYTVFIRVLLDWIGLHYADFPVTSATSLRQARDIPATRYGEVGDVADFPESFLPVTSQRLFPLPTLIAAESHKIRSFCIYFVDQIYM